jgi:Rrf2 family cysteine metabolism transcriptional repressor
MLISRKCRYALRAVLELAMRNGKGPVKIADIAEAQAIPARFLEAILSQLKEAGLVVSRRGKEGGYFLDRSPDEITIGHVVESIQGSSVVVECMTSLKDRCTFYSDCVFLPVWEEAQEAIADIYSRFTFQHLADSERQRARNRVITYSI